MNFSPLLTASHTSLILWVKCYIGRSFDKDDVVYKEMCDKLLESC